MKEDLDKIFCKYPANKKDRLIPILQEIQEVAGHLTDEILTQVGKELNLPANKIYGVAAFYDQFRFQGRGQYHIRVCKGTACHIHGTSTYVNEIQKQLKIKHGKTSKDKKYSLEITNCLGACSSAPVIQVNDLYFTQVNPQDLDKILRSLKEKSE